ncbi:hypothetical protein [Aureimonas populi]|uniref:DUF3035 domain-containing protein n=1 Tax=Aureimonas populi TaxID=1701758 RepID=A0ABW5CIX5_9HYPH|nr:hypothetical protein [Aureimonas populi]
MAIQARRLFAGLLLGTGALALAGCNTGPTYGTGVSQAGQLFSDVDGLFTLGSTNRQEIAYVPRPELVRPASIGALPPPQAPVSARNDPNWPQSPEAIRAQNLAAGESTRGEATLPANYNPSLGGPASQAPRRGSGLSRAEQDGSWLSPEELRAGGQRATQQRADNQGSPTQRRYLSEPPVDYRQPSQTAPVGDPGLDEEVKQRRQQGTQSLGSRIRQSLPF